jgi:hypothetical protein
MSLDRRIVSILYYNNIFDVNSVEEFIGEKNNFYEIKIDGKIMKLEIPNKGFEFNEVIESVNNNKLLSSKIEIIDVDNMPQLETLQQNLETQKVENIEEKVKIEKIKKTNPKISNKKIQIVDSKKVDDDFDSFINII